MSGYYEYWLVKLAFAMQGLFKVLLGCIKVQWMNETTILKTTVMASRPISLTLN